MFFQEFEKLINHDYEAIEFANTVNKAADPNWMQNGWLPYMKSHLCGKNWNEMIKLDDRKIITCKADTPGNVKQSCPDICNRLSRELLEKTGKYIL